MTRTKSKTATQTQVIALAVLGLAAAAGFGYIGYSLPKQLGTPIADGRTSTSPPGYNPGGYNPQGYNPQGYNPPGYNPPGYALVGKPTVAKFSCSYLGWDVKTDVTPIAKVAKSSVIKGTGTTLYWYGANGKRYVFPNENTYRTWYPYGTCPVITKVSNADLPKVLIGGSVTYRPGSRMIKLVSDPSVYVISKGGTVHFVDDVTKAAAMYGDNWYQMFVDVVPDAFFVNYAYGSPLSVYNVYNPAVELSNSPTIDADKGL